MYHTLPAVLPLQRRQRSCTGRSNLHEYIQQQIQQNATIHKKYNKTAKEWRSKMTADHMTTNNTLPSLAATNNNTVDNDATLTTTTPLNTTHNNNESIAKDVQKEEKEQLRGKEETVQYEEKIESKIAAHVDAVTINNAHVKHGNNKGKLKMQNVNRRVVKSNSSTHSRLSKAKCSNTLDSHNTCDFQNSNVAEEYLLRDGVCYTPSTKRNLREYEVFLHAPNYTVVKPSVSAASHHGGCLEYNDPWTDKSGCYNRTVAACHIRDAHLKDKMPQKKRNGALYQSYCVIKMSSSSEEEEEWEEEQQYENHETLQYIEEECMRHEHQVKKEHKHNGCHVHTEIMSLQIITPETRSATQDNNSYQKNKRVSNAHNTQHSLLHHRRLSEEWLTHNYAPSVDPYNVQPFRGRCGYSDFNLRFNLTQPDTRSAMFASPAEQFRATSNVPLETPNKWQILSSRHH